MAELIESLVHRGKLLEGGIRNKMHSPQFGEEHGSELLDDLRIMVFSVCYPIGIENGSSQILSKPRVVVDLSGFAAMLDQDFFARGLHCVWVFIQDRESNQVTLNRREFTVKYCSIFVARLREVEWDLLVLFHDTAIFLLSLKLLFFRVG